MQPISLQKWAKENDPSETNLIYKDSFWNQIIFVRDTLTGIVYQMYGGDYEVAKRVADNILALSTHKSKSVELPVFHMTLPEGTECVMRYNFHDWKISVKASQPVNCDFLGLVDTDEVIHAVYCEGFPDEWVFSSYNSNHQEFTVELGSEYHVYMFFSLLINDLTPKHQEVAA